MFFLAVFHVIHLSDLHIGRTLALTHYKLLADIKKQINTLNDKNIFLLITGDIIDKGDYTHNYSAAISFFEELKKNTGERIADIQIAPGNHDKDNKHSPYAKFTSTSLQYENETKVQDLEEIFNLQEGCFSEFINLCNKIFEIFGLKKNIDTTNGIEFYNENELNLCFIRINTALITCGNPNEEYRLKIDFSHLKNTITQYQNKKNELGLKDQKMLTFCLAHHPTSFLLPIESQVLNNSLIEEECLNVDFFLCGHTHERSVSNLSNHTRRMTTLVTGIGWNHQTGTSIDSAGKLRHRYSIYTFDENKNVYTVTMRKTTEKGDFAPDSDYFINDEERETQKICYPLEERSQAFISVNNYSPTEKRYIAADNEVINNLQVLSKCLCKYTSDCSAAIENYKHLYFKHLLKNEKIKKDFFEKINSSYEAKMSVKEVMENIINDESIYKENPKILHEQFKSFLLDIVTLLSKYLTPYFGDGVMTRAAIRTYTNTSSKEEKYIPFVYFPKQISPRNAKENGNITGFPREYDWNNSLVQHSYCNQCCPMIYSVNKKYNNFNTDNWEDFIVFVPNFASDIVYQNKTNVGVSHEERPLLSYTFSVRLENKDDYEKNSTEYKQKMKQISNKLFLLEHLKIHEIILNLLIEFRNSLPINIKEFFKTLEKNE